MGPMLLHRFYEKTAFRWFSGFTLVLIVGETEFEPACDKV